MMVGLGYLMFVGATFRRFVVVDRGWRCCHENCGLVWMVIGRSGRNAGGFREVKEVVVDLKLLNRLQLIVFGCNTFAPGSDKAIVVVGPWCDIEAGCLHK